MSLKKFLREPTPEEIEVAEKALIVDHGNGVFTFKHGSCFIAEALSRFIAENPNLEFISLAGDGGYTSNSRYTVVFREKK